MTADNPIIDAIAEGYECPDCNAEKELHRDHLGVWHLTIRHDATCPELARIEAQR